MDSDIEYKQALNKALVILKYNDRTCLEVRERLLKNGFMDDTVTRVIDYLSEQHFLDDRRYAEYYVTCYSSKRSVSRIRKELEVKGIENYIIEEALEEADDSEALKKALKKQLLRRNISDISEADYIVKRKISEALYRQGFQADKIRSLIN